MTVLDMLRRRLASAIMPAADDLSMPRDFPVGDLASDEIDRVRGLDSETFSPTVYGEYALKNVAVYACVKVRAHNLAALPLRFYRTGADGVREEVVGAPINELFGKINPYWTASRLLRMTEWSLCLWGSAFWVLTRSTNPRQPPLEMWWVRPDRMRVVPHPDNYISGYLYGNEGEEVAFDASEVIWLRYENPLQEFAGLSPLASARMSIDAGADALLANRNLFKQGLQMGGIITPAAGMPPFQRDQVEAFEKMLNRRFTGVDKAHRWAVLSGAAKMETLGVNPRDAEFINLMKWSLADVCRIYGVPPILVQDFERATYSNAEQAYKALWTDTLLPEAAMIASDITEQLLPMFPDVDACEFDTSGVASLQQDRGAIINQISALFDRGVPLNRLLQELAPWALPADEAGYPWGDVGYLPATLVPTTDLAAPAPEVEAEDNDRAVRDVERALQLVAAREPEPSGLADDLSVPAFASDEHDRIWQLFVKATEEREQEWITGTRDYFRRQRDSVLAKLRGDGARDVTVRAIDDVARKPFDEVVWGKRLRALAKPLLTSTLLEAARSTTDDLGVDTAFNVKNPLVVRWLERRTQRFATEVNDTTWRALKASLAEGIDAGESIPTMEQRVRKVFSTASEQRATMIARTEVVGASNAGSIEAADQSGVVETKRWISALDERTRDTHRVAHGQVVGLRENFSVGGVRGPAPGQIGSAAEDIMCRCTVVFGLKAE